MTLKSPLTVSSDFLTLLVVVGLPSGIEIGVFESSVCFVFTNL